MRGRGDLKRLVIHAPGGGSGHATRAGRLASALASMGACVRVLVGEGKARLVTDTRVEVRELPRVERPDELARAVRVQLDEVEAEHLVVDALPYGVLGELRDFPLAIERTLLLRLHEALPALSAHDRVIDIEPNLAWFDGGLACGPLAPDPAEPETNVDALLIASDAELTPFIAKLGRRLRARGHSVAVANGVELALWGEAPCATRIDLFRFRPRVLVGPAGYNLTYEAAAANVPHLALARRRRHDDQSRRARDVCEVPNDPLALEARVLAILDTHEPRRREIECVGYDALARCVLG